MYSSIKTKGVHYFWGLIPIALIMPVTLLEARTIHHSVMCTKDLQVRFILVEKTESQNQPFLCKIKKMSETVLSGMFQQMSEAESCLHSITKSFSDLGWKCQKEDVEYLGSQR
ncbi:MAG: hypothetical protein NZ480_02695 [Bdellovibrionaceae bacterium]|nr:hypothetical protein [Pseudobdellovibrionaceae bacterium]MDW8189448.1 hypothetical protein [Pseudobdellovibrionaceae bacterium]